MGNITPSLDQAEHIGSATGDNVEAKKVGNYAWGTGDEWARQPLPLVDVPYDSSVFSDPDANGNYQTIDFKTGGSGGTTVRTLSLTFDENNNVTSIERN